MLPGCSRLSVFLPSQRSDEDAIRQMNERMELTTARRTSHLDTIRERRKERELKAELVRARRESPHIKPLSHGTSLLNELPEASELQTRPPSRGGVAFHIDSGEHRPRDLPTLMTEVRRADVSYL